MTRSTKPRKRPASIVLRDLKRAIEQAEAWGLSDDAEVVVRHRRGPRWLWSNLPVELASAGWVTPVDRPVFLIVTKNRNIPARTRLRSPIVESVFESTDCDFD